MDKAHLSRILARFRARGLAQSRVSPKHGKQMILTLTEAGRKTFAAADAAARAQVDALLLPVDERGRERLAEAMRDIRAALEDREAEDPGVCLRPLKPGDVGWIIHRQAVLYHQEYGWDWTYEGLASRILGDFVAEFDPSREDGWVAERRGAIAGSIFLMKSDDPAVAKLRLLYVEPSARGLGIGRTLVGACIARAREFGYHELTLWTNDVLVSARRIYQAAGFRLVSEAPAPFVRPRSRRADLGARFGLTASGTRRLRSASPRLEGLTGAPTAWYLSLIDTDVAWPAHGKSAMATAKIFMHGRSQAVRLPKEFRLPGKEVRVSKVGDKVILEPLSAENPLLDWKAFWAEIDALGGENLFRDGPPADPPVEPDRRKFLEP